ncbi:MAG: ABC transporter permease subunit, partial [Tyzzerella sp.]|nr:ABC transporter permease subunit [Tyzzerella sp.]
MTILKHELRQNRAALLIWTVVISFMIGVCVFIYPEMKGEMESISDVFADMGSFSAAFGMDQINFGTMLGYYAIECGNVLGLGGAFFAAICGSGILAKEEKEHTVEFLMTHPVSRSKVITQKLISVMLQIVVLNVIVFAVVVAGMAVIGENVPWKEMFLLHG